MKRLYALLVGVVMPLAGCEANLDGPSRFPDADVDVRGMPDLDPRTDHDVDVDIDGSGMPRSNADVDLPADITPRPNVEGEVDGEADSYQPEIPR